MTEKGIRARPSLDHSLPDACQKCHGGAEQSRCAQRHGKGMGVHCRESKDVGREVLETTRVTEIMLCPWLDNGGWKITHLVCLTSQLGPILKKATISDLT